MDTDSLYVCLDSLVTKVGLTDKTKIVDFLDKACEKIEEVIEEVKPQVRKKSSFLDDIIIKTTGWLKDDYIE